ncbi:MAG: carboxypeptidase-like regulatory domain-containing protein [Candidatus Poribacteria bacterium]|nr:carboxypeptidase-like regulatory domain-containing protein [Candidatus Poribacteria bacterium]
MNRQNFLHEIVLIAVVITICTLLGCGETEYASPFKPSEDGTAVFSGRVVDENGDPVAELTLAIQPNEVELQTSDVNLEIETDASGRFSITDIHPGSWRLAVVPYVEVDDTEPFYGILSIKIGEISLKPDFDLHTLSSFDRTTFSITPGVHVQDVEIVVQRRMRIGTTVVFTDGTPLANKEVSISIKTRNLNGHNSGRSWGPARTDSQGYLERYVNRIGFYTVSVEYDEVSAVSEEFILNAGERREDLILKLPSAPK